MSEKTYEQGLYDGQMQALKENMLSLAKDTRECFQKQSVEIDGLKKAVWMLYGAIGIVGFVLPLLQKILANGA